MSRKAYASILASILLTLSFLTSCSSSSHSTPPPPTVTIAATSGTPQNTMVGTAFAAPLVATVMTGGSPTSGVVVTFTAPASGASGTFADTTTNTTTATTNASGMATSAVFTANATAGGPYSVTATAPAATGSANFSLTNNSTATTLAPGNYVFSLTGGDANGFYTLAGVFTVASSGVISGGEQDFSDFNNFAHDAISSGSVVASTDGNLLITLNTGDIVIGPGGNGTETLNATLVSTSKALLTEFDSSASSSGELDLQATGLSGPSGSYAFFTTGLDAANGFPIAIGGVINVDSAGGISGAGSVYDVNDAGMLSPGQLFTASTVSTTPDSFGMVTFTLNTSSLTSPGVIVDGYMVDASHIRLVENWRSDNLRATTGGTALGQTGAGSFSTSSISGFSYVFGTAGGDIVSGAQQAAGILTFNSNGTVSGTLSFNDLTTQNVQGGSTLAAGTYTVDSTGRVTLTGLTDSTISPTFNYNLQLYLKGDGNALVISMDSADVLAGVGDQQAISLTAGSFSGNYALDVGQTVPSGVSLFEQDGVGTITANGGSLTGFLDVNESGIPASDLALSGTFAIGSTNGLLTGTITDPVSGISDTFTYYIVDTTKVVAIENDANQLTLGFFELQH
jgi:hypothetical protein